MNFMLEMSVFQSLEKTDFQHELLLLEMSVFQSSGKLSFLHTKVHFETSPDSGKHWVF